MDIITVSPSKRSWLVQLTGFLFFGFLFFLCWHYFRERMLAYDATFLDFKMMESGTFYAGPGRYGDWIAEAFGWMSFKMGLSLATILIAHSVGFIVFYYTIFLFITLKLRNDGAGIALMLVCCLGYFHTFYFPMMQLHESLVLGILLWAFIHPENPYLLERQKRMATIGAIITIFCMSYFHPLGIFVIGFVLGIEMVGYKRYRDPQIWTIILLGIGWFLLKSLVISRQAYDQDRIVPFSTILHQLPDFKNWESTKFVYSLTKLHFRSLLLITLFCLALSFRKGILFLLFCLGFFLVFTLIYLGNFYRGESLIVYENYYILYGFFTGLLFVFLFYQPLRKNLVLVVTIPMIWFSVMKMYHAHNLYTSRASYVSRLVQDARKAGGKKYIVDSRCYPDNYAGAEWDIAFETLLCSSLQSPDSTVTVFITKPEFNKLCDTNLNRNNILLGVHFSPLWFTSNDMPGKYFRLPSSGYQYLTHSQDDTSFHERVFSNQNIKIIPVEQTIYANVNDWVAVAPIRIENKSGHTIPAIPRSKNPIELNYILYDKKGNLRTGYVPTPFESDINDGTVTGVIIYLPFEKGTFYAKPDIIAGDNNWWNVSSPLIKVVIN